MLFVNGVRETLGDIGEMEEEEEYRRKERIALLVIVVVASVAVASLLVAFSYYCYIRNKVSKRLKDLQSEPHSHFYSIPFSPFSQYPTECWFFVFLIFYSRVFELFAANHFRFSLPFVWLLRIYAPIFGEISTESFFFLIEKLSCIFGIQVTNVCLCVVLVA